MRIALMMSVCENDKAIAAAAVTSLVRRRAGYEIDVYVQDDASPSRVGVALAEHCRRNLGISAQVNELPFPVGFRGGVTRFTMLMNWIASTGIEYDLLVKIDPDSLVLRDDWLDSFSADVSARGGRGIWSIARPFRKQDALLFLLDLLPMGFRRKKTGTLIDRKWELRRWRPVWWAGIGWRALFRGLRSRYSHGAFYAIGGETFRDVARRGFFKRLKPDRHGFFTSEEDPMATVFAYSVGDRLIDLNELVPGWGNAYWGPDLPPATVVASGMYVVHPLKDNEAGRKNRTLFMEAMQRGIERVRVGAERAVGAAIGA